MSFKVSCEKCGCDLYQVCKPELRAAIIQLFKWAPQSGFPDQLKEGNDWVRQEPSTVNPDTTVDNVDNEGVPFLSERFLYALLGKEDGRTLQALIHGIIREAGLDPYALGLEAYKEVSAELEERAQREKRRKERAAQKAKGNG